MADNGEHTAEASREDQLRLLDMKHDGASMKTDGANRAPKRKSKKSSAKKKKDKSTDDGTKKPKKSRKGPSKSDKNKSSVERTSSRAATETETERSSSVSMHDPTLEAAGGVGRIAVVGPDENIVRLTSRQDKLAKSHNFLSFGTTEREQLNGAADIIREMEENKPSPVPEKAPGPDHSAWKHPSEQSLGYASYRTPEPTSRNPRGPVNRASPPKPTDQTPDEAPEQATAPGEATSAPVSARPIQEAPGVQALAVRDAQPATIEAAASSKRPQSRTSPGSKHPKTDVSSTGEETEESKKPARPHRSPKSQASGWTSTTSQDEEEESSSEDYDSKEYRDNVGKMRADTATDGDSSWNFDGDSSVGSSVISDITYETLKQQHMMKMMGSSSHGGRRSRLRKRGSSRSNSLRNLENPKEAIMEEYDYDEGGLSNPAVEALRALGNKPPETWENLEELSLPDATRRSSASGTQDAATGPPLTSGDDKEKAHDLLLMYLLSVGTDPTAAREIAANFTNGPEEKRPSSQVMSKAAKQPRPNERHRKSMGQAASAQTSSAPAPEPSAIEAKLAEVMGPTTRAAVIGASAQDRNNNPRGRRQSPSWDGFDQAGAIQMEGRAFGATPRPQGNTVAHSPQSHQVPKEPRFGDQITSPEGKTGYVSSVGGKPFGSKVIESDDTSRDSSRQKMSDVVTLEDTPWSPSSLWKEHSIRRLAYLALFMTVVVIIASTAAVYAKGRSGAETEANTPAEAPSMQPTRIDDDMVLEVLSFSPAVREEGTPQRRAIGWLSTIDQSNVDLNDVRFIQRYVLATLYFATEGDNWKDNEDWLGPTQHECDWGRVTIACNSTRHVSGLSFVNTGLVGSLPPEVGLLTEVTSLNFASNTLKGTLPSEIFKLNRLTNLEMQQNELSGTLPASIANVSLLQNLDLSTNKFESSLPDSIYDLTLLTNLNLSSNDFSGVFAQSGLSKLMELVTIDLRRNRFEGGFPSRFEETPKLQFIYFDHNRFSGSVPELSGSLLSRQELTISHNRITGTLPTFDPNDLSSLPAGGLDSVVLRKIDISSNLMDGTIPILTGLITSLEEIDLSNNKFSGTFPTNATLWPSIKSLKAAGNRLEGPVPSDFLNREEVTVVDFSDNLMSLGMPTEFGHFEKIQYLSLRNNPIGGSIPSELALPAIKTLDLSNCRMTGSIPSALLRAAPKTLNLANNSIEGTIPTDIGEVSSLVSLRLEGNELTGEIPSEIGKLEFLRILTLRDNELVGTIPHQLGSLSALEKFSIAGNKLEGDIPQGLCLSDLSVKDIGCDIGCTCCADLGTECGNRLRRLRGVFKPYPS